MDHEDGRPNLAGGIAFLLGFVRGDLKDLRVVGYAQVVLLALILWRSW